MKACEIIPSYFEGYSVKQIVNKMYEEGKDMKGKPTITKDECLEIVEREILMELKKISQEVN